MNLYIYAYRLVITKTGGATAGAMMPAADQFILCKTVGMNASSCQFTVSGMAGATMTTEAVVGIGTVVAETVILAKAIKVKAIKAKVATNQV